MTTIRGLFLNFDSFPPFFYIPILQTASTKREIALRTLGQLVENTGYVVEPYIQYPSLLETLLNFLKTEQNPKIRRETLKVIGYLGALDPYRHKMLVGAIEVGETEGTIVIR